MFLWFFALGLQICSRFAWIIPQWRQFRNVVPAMSSLAFLFSFLIYAKKSCTILCVFFSFGLCWYPHTHMPNTYSTLYLWLLVWYLDYFEPFFFWSLFCTISQTSPCFKDLFFIVWFWQVTLRMCWQNDGGKYYVSIDDVIWFS